MELLLILTYVAVVTIIFKIFRIPLNKWTVPTAILGGFIFLGTLIALMNYNHPYSERARNYFVQTPIIPNVKGQVIEVVVKPNLLIKKGDVLFKIDSTPYKNKYKSLEARYNIAKHELDRQLFLLKKNATSANNVDIAKSKVDSIKAELANAKFELDSTIVRAPTDGYVTHLLVRPGMMATPTPMRPLMTFVHEARKRYVGWFRQNSLLRLTPGEEAEISFQAIPGKIFRAKVELVLPFMAEGQLQAGGKLIDSMRGFQQGRIPVVVGIIDEEFEKYYADKLPGGSSAEIAIYTDHVHHVAVMRKILMRMASWMNYLFPFH